MDIFEDIVKQQQDKREQTLVSNVLGSDGGQIPLLQRDPQQQQQQQQQQRLSRSDEDLVIGLKYKMVVDHLRDTRHTMSTDDLRELLDAEDYPKVDYSRLGAQGRGTYAYRSKYDIRSVEDLRMMLTAEDNRLAGLDRDEVADSYNGAQQDLEKMLSSGEIFAIASRHKTSGRKRRGDKTSGDNVYHAEPEYGAPDLDPRLRDMWRGAEVGKEVHDLIRGGLKELKAEMERCGLSTIEWETDKLRKRKVAEGEIEDDRAGRKRRRRGGRLKMTNVHLGEEIDLTKEYDPVLEKQREAERIEQRKREEELQKAEEMFLAQEAAREEGAAQ